MIDVDVRVAQGVREGSRDEMADVRQHVCEESVGGDVEGHAEADVAGALVEEAVERTSAGCGTVVAVVAIVGVIGIVGVAIAVALRIRRIHVIINPTPTRMRKRNIELRKHMTRRQRHLAEISRVPGREDDAAVVGCVL